MHVEDWMLTAEERENPATATPGAGRGQPGRTARPRRDLLRPAGRRGRGAGRRATTCSSPTGAAIPTSGCAPTAPPSPSCSPRRRERGVVVKGLMWRSHLDRMQFSEEENRHLGDDVERGRRRGAARPAGPPGRLAPPEAGRAASPGAPDRDVAFAGGIDLCHSRRDDAATTVTRRRCRCRRRYGERPAVARRPAGAARAGGRARWTPSFRERWTDPTRLDLRSPVALAAGPAAAAPT